ncbi:MAG: CHRD domain-containing protein [Pseudomonadota bacterium]
MTRQRRALGVAAALLLACGPVWAADYEAQMDPAPFDASTRADILGSIGQVSATLTGNTLTVNGTFKDMTSPATAASLRTGLMKGVLGEAIGTLTVTRTPQGTVSGSVQLTPAQVEALNREAIYVRVDSEKAPDGNLQGWLEAKRN